MLFLAKFFLNSHLLYERSLQMFIQEMIWLWIFPGEGSNMLLVLEMYLILVLNGVPQLFVTISINSGLLTMN